ncbi:MAG: glycosyltransferase, partial [Candidatus Thermoplasmatota archaeon]|nr:glycosyltransferase [Candidatus Thermoplasmatota archaeon]
MKILHVGAYPPTCGGPANGARAIAQEQASCHDVAVLHMDERRIGMRHWHDGPVEVFRREMPFDGFTSIQKSVFALMEGFSFRDRELIQIHDPYLMGASVANAKAPTVLHLHGYPSLEGIARARIKPGSVSFALSRTIEKQAVNMADAVVCVDSTLAKWAMRQLGAPEEKVHVIPNGVDGKMFTASKSVGGDIPLVVCIRRFTPKNGVE